MLVGLSAECHKRRRYTGNVFAGCLAIHRVPICSDMRLDRKKVIEFVLYSLSWKIIWGSVPSECLQAVHRIRRRAGSKGSQGTPEFEQFRGVAVEMSAE